MPGQIVKLEGDGLGFHLQSKGWAEGYIVIFNLAILHRVFKTCKEAQEFADSFPINWKPQIHMSVEDIPSD